MTALAEVNIMPFNDILSLIHNMPSLDGSIGEKHDKRTQQILAEPSDLGIFNELSRNITIIQNRYPPIILKPEIAIFVATQNVENALNPIHKENITTLVQELQSGKHIINQACNIAGCGLKTYDLNSELATEDIRTEAAMTEVEATQIIAYSMESVQDTDLLIISEIGSHQKTATYALIKALYYTELPDDCKFSDAVNDAIRFHGLKHSPLEFLRRLGSREITAMIGAIIASRYQNVPIILDGLSALVAASIVAKINPNGIEHCMLGHAYNDDIYNFLAHQLNLQPIAFLDINLDAGIGSTVAVNMIKTAIAIHNYTNK